MCNVLIIIALILRYFERGAKLNDSSNRYQHTCKSCGEKFPKGRIDSLTTHLIKKCPAITLEDRREALLALNNMPSNSEASRHGGGIQINGPTVDLSIGGPRSWTALETLAEVSRQMVTSETHDGHPDGAANGAGEQPQNDRLELQEQYTLDNPPVSYELRTQRDKKCKIRSISYRASLMKYTATNQKATRQESRASPAPPNFQFHLTDSRSNSPNLAMAASSMAAAAAARHIPSMVDPQLLADDQTMAESKALALDLHEGDTVMSDTFYNTNHDQHAAWQNFEGMAGMYPEPEQIEQNIETVVPSRPPSKLSYPPLAMVPMNTEFATEFGNGEKSSKQRVRGKFTSERRKEVQSVRKSGACIRCRMLRKTCSVGDPCDTCKSVDSPRLWKNACIRTKLAENFELYSCGLHVVLAHNSVQKQKGRAQFYPAPFEIEASHFPFPDTSIYATFKALEAQQMPSGGNIDPGLSAGLVPITIHLLDDNDDIPGKLNAYLKRMVEHYVDKEPSHFMKTTLRTAQRLAMEKQDRLLSDAIELWVAVHILVAPELYWSFSEKVDSDPQSGNGPNIHTDSANQFLDLQINAAAEKKAAKLCRDVLSNLEKRLLRRDPDSFFETFLIALIILNCVEKSTWLFTYWKQDNFKGTWPLENGQDMYMVQGESTINHLVMLLRYRNAPPKTRSRPEDGLLVVDPIPGNENAVTYYTDLSLTYDQIQHAQVNSNFDLADSRCFELMYCSKLLLPAN